MRVLVTGAAGFIGSHVVDELVAAGHDVTALDGLIPEVHPSGVWPLGRCEGIRRLTVDLSDADGVAGALQGIEAVVHQAALVGHGLNLADLPRYAAMTDLGTATLLAAMHAEGIHKLVLASSMVVYGEGRYRCTRHGDTVPLPRRVEDLEEGIFDPRCPSCGQPLGWDLVTEAARLNPTSVYATSKLAQEFYVAAWSRGLQVTTVALRYHNVYGPRMPRNSPYSGVAALFRSRVADGLAPLVFEDGKQMRDFVHVADIARANRLALEADLDTTAPGLVPLNVCSGSPRSVGWAARTLAAADAGPPPEYTGQHRAADVRHVVADPARARDLIGFNASISPEEGFRRFARDQI